jgi:hypothetical protein
MAVAQTENDRKKGEAEVKRKTQEAKEDRKYLPMKAEDQILQQMAPAGM